MGEKKLTPDLYPFIAIAFARNSKLHPYIDSLFSSDYETYSRLSKNNKWYNSSLFKSYDLPTQDYANKLVGLIEYIPEEKMKAMIKKGWPKFYSWAMSNKPIQVEDCLDNFFTECLSNPEYILFAIAIIFAAANAMNKTVFMSDETGNMLKSLSDVYLDISKKNVFFYSNNLLKEELEFAVQIMQDMCESKLNNKTFKSIWLSSDTNAKYLAVALDGLLQLEELSKDILESGELNNKELAEICFAYMCATVGDNPDSYSKEKIKSFTLGNPDSDYFRFMCSSLSQTEENAFSSIIYMICIRKLLKAYKKAKTFYSKRTAENNKSMNNLTRKIAELENKNKVLTGQLNSFTPDEIKKKVETKYQKILHQQIRENKKLDDTIKDLESKISSYKKEIVLLNNLNDEMVKELSNNHEDEIDYNFINSLTVKNIKGVIVGGHPSWQNMLKGYLPNFKFIEANSNNFDASVLKHADAVFFNTTHASHSLFYKVISAVKDTDIDIHYINRNNKKYLLRKLNQIAC